MSLTLEQMRAHDAWQRIEGMKDKDYGNYASYVKALPATILTLGLGQALAMEKAGASKAGSVGFGHLTLYQQMHDWLCTKWLISPYRDEKDILYAVTCSDQTAYIRAQVEALSYLGWLKRFAVAELDDASEKEE